MLAYNAALLIGEIAHESSKMYVLFGPPLI